MTHTFRKTVILAALASAAAGVAGTASAQQGLQARSPSPDRGAYAGIGLGTSNFDSICNGAASCDDKDSGGKIFGGYNFNSNLGVELGYHDLGGFSASSPAPAFTGSGDVTGWELSGVGRWPVTQQLSVFGKLGAFRWDRSISNTGAAFGGAGSDTGTDWTWGFGANYQFTRNVGARLEWQQFKDVGASGSDVNAVTASAVFRF